MLITIRPTSRYIITGRAPGPIGVYLSLNLFLVVVRKAIRWTLLQSGPETNMNNNNKYTHFIYTQ